SVGVAVVLRRAGVAVVRRGIAVARVGRRAAVVAAAAPPAEFEPDIHADVEPPRAIGRRPLLGGRQDRHCQGTPDKEPLHVKVLSLFHRPGRVLPVRSSSQDTSTIPSADQRRRAKTTGQGKLLDCASLSAAGAPNSAERALYTQVAAGSQ